MLTFSMRQAALVLGIHPSVLVTWVREGFFIPLQGSVFGRGKRAKLTREDLYRLYLFMSLHDFMGSRKRAALYSQAIDLGQNGPVEYWRGEYGFALINLDVVKTHVDRKIEEWRKP